MLKYFLAWFPMLLLAILNGSLRDLGYKKYLGELTAHQLSTFTLIILFAFYIGFIIYRLPPTSSTQAILAGLLWIVLTLCFEFGFGKARGHSWQELFVDYNIMKGRVWILIPVWVFIAPYIFYRVWN